MSGSFRDFNFKIKLSHNHIPIIPNEPKYQDKFIYTIDLKVKKTNPSFTVGNFTLFPELLFSLHFPHIYLS